MPNLLVCGEFVIYPRDKTFAVNPTEERKTWQVHRIFMVAVCLLKCLHQVCT